MIAAVPVLWPLTWWVEGGAGRIEEVARHRAFGIVARYLGGHARRWHGFWFRALVLKKCIADHTLYFLTDELREMADRRTEGKRLQRIFPLVVELETIAGRHFNNDSSGDFRYPITMYDNDGKKIVRKTILELCPLNWLCADIIR